MMKKFTILAAIAALAILCSCGGGGGGLLSKSPTDLVEEMNTMVQKGDYAKAVQFWYDHSQKKEKGAEKAPEKEPSKEEIDQMVNAFGDKMKAQAEKNNGITKIEVIEETIDETDNTATVITEYTYGNGKTSKERNYLVKVDGKWMFDSSSK